MLELHLFWDGGSISLAGLLLLPVEGRSSGPAVPGRRRGGGSDEHGGPVAKLAALKFKKKASSTWGVCLLFQLLLPYFSLITNLSYKLAT
jgi:hypothetical protein